MTKRQEEMAHIKAQTMAHVFEAVVRAAQTMGLDAAEYLALLSEQLCFAAITHELSLDVVLEGVQLAYGRMAENMAVMDAVQNCHTDDKLKS